MSLCSQDARDFHISEISTSGEYGSVIDGFPVGSYKSGARAFQASGF